MNIFLVLFPAVLTGNRATKAKGIMFWVFAVFFMGNA
jgi:hypothetical protein